MNLKRHRPRWAALLVLIALAQGASLAQSGDAPSKPAPPPAAPATGAAAPGPTTDAPAEKEKSLREQTIYVPYEKLRKIFEKEGRGVFLPYEKFRELWQAAQERKEAPEPKPPVGAVITEIDNEATVSKDVVRVRAVLKVEVLAEGWNEIPLRLADAAITEATLAGQPARLVSVPGSGYKLLVEKKGKSPETLELVLQYAKAISRAPGQNSVSFDSPQAPVNRWKVRIPEAGVKVNLHPLIAAMDVTPSPGEKKPESPPGPPPEKKPEPAAPPEKKAEPAAKPAEKKPEPAARAEETVVLAFVGAAPTVRIEWTPKAEGATGLEALATVQAEQQVSIHEGVTRTRTQLAYAISRAELRQLAIEVPADQKVANVFDANVRQWSVEPAAETQKITVQLFEAAKQSQGVTVELEKYTEEAKQAVVQVPVVKALAVGRQQGVVVVQVVEGLRADATRSGGLLQLDAAELPAALKGRPWAFAYRYASVPYDLQLSVEKVQPRILVDALVEAELQPERLSVDMLAIYTVQRAGVFRLELDLPPGFEVRQVRGRAAAGAEEAQVDTHHLEGKEKTRLVVNLARKALGRVGLAVQLEKELREPDLLAPTGKAAQLPLVVPGPVPESVERATGRLLVSAAEKLQVNPAKPEGLRSISFKEALDGMEPARQQKAPDSRPVLAYAYTQQRGSLTLVAERRKPQVTIGQFLSVNIREGEIEYRATFFYNVLYSGVKSLRIDVPDLDPPIQNLSRATIREKVIDPPPAKLEKGYVAWSLTGETELIGQGKIELTWKTSTGKLDVGGSIPVPVPRLRPREVDRAWGQVALVKADTFDVQEDAGRLKGLRPIDPQHDLMPGASAPGAARAYEFHDDDWELAVSATRYRLEEIKHTSIERAVLRMVVTRAGKIAVQALYRVRSAEQRLGVRLPDGVKIDVRPRINGTQVTLEQGQEPEREFFVPLTGRNPDEPFLLELRYTVPGDGRRLEHPDFLQDPAVQKVYLAAYLPQEWALLGRSGPWTEEFSWNLSRWGDWKPTPHLSDSGLASWVMEGCKMATQGDAFPTDGRMYLFSAIQPQSAMQPDEATGKDGSLRLARFSENWLHAIVFAGLIAAGAALLGARAATRGLAIGGLVVALVLCGVFLPTFARQVLNGTLAAAIFVVLVVWIGWYLKWSWPRRPRPPQTAAASPSPGPGQQQGEAGTNPFAKDAPAEDAPKTGHEEGGKTHG